MQSKWQGNTAHAGSSQECRFLPPPLAALLINAVHRNPGNKELPQNRRPECQTMTSDPPSSGVDFLDSSNFLFKAMILTSSLWGVAGEMEISNSFENLFKAGDTLPRKVQT